MVWAHLLSNTSAFTNPFEFREIMMASVGWTEETIEEVQARHEANANQRDATRKAKTKPGSTSASRAPTVAGATVPAKAEMDKLQALMANAKRFEHPGVTDLDKPPE